MNNQTMTSGMISELAFRTVRDLREWCSEHEIESSASDLRIRAVAEDQGMEEPTRDECQAVRDAIASIVG